MEQLRQRTKLNFSETPDPRGQSAPDTPRVAASTIPSIGGNALKYLRVNSGATGLEWATVSGGGAGYTVASTATSYTETATSGEKIVKVTASGQTVTLPTAVGNTAKLTFKLMVAGTLTLDGNASETIDGGATATLTTQYEAVTIVSDNANWIVI